ncbi:MAG: hypothetical protein AAGA77_15105 [Bacteroidota bacterium]
MNTISLSTINLIDQSLANDISKNNMMELAHMLPPTHNGIFECNLGSHSMGEMDFAHGFHTRYDEEGLYAMGKYLQKLSINGEYIERLKSRLSNSGEQLIESIWFEYDTSRPEFTFAPSVFFDMPTINYLYKNLANGDLRLWHRWLNEVLQPFNTPHTIPENIEIVVGCIEALPSYSFVSHIGVMLGREGALKLCATINNTNEVLKYLIEDLGMHCTVESITKIERLLDISDYAVVNIDIRDATIVDNFGIECYISKDHPNNRLWFQYLTHLESMDLCTGMQKASLIDWNFSSPVALDQDFEIHRKINHTKIGVEKGLLQRAKAYLYFLKL